jgi:hypothetical protein
MRKKLCWVAGVARDRRIEPTGRRDLVEDDLQGSQVKADGRRKGMHFLRRCYGHTRRSNFLDISRVRESAASVRRGDENDLATRFLGLADVSEVGM